MGVLLLCGCAAQRATYINQRDAPDLVFKGPLRPVSLSAPQIKQVQQGIARACQTPAPRPSAKATGPRSMLMDKPLSAAISMGRNSRVCSQSPREARRNSCRSACQWTGRRKIRSNNIAVTMAFIFRNSEIEVLPKRGLQRPMHAS